MSAQLSFDNFSENPDVCVSLHVFIKLKIVRLKLEFFSDETFLAFLQCFFCYLMGSVSARFGFRNWRLNFFSCDFLVFSATILVRGLIPAPKIMSNFYLAFLNVLHWWQWSEHIVLIAQQPDILVFYIVWSLTSLTLFSDFPSELLISMQDIYDGNKTACISGQSPKCSDCAKANWKVFFWLHSWEKKNFSFLFILSPHLLCKNLRVCLASRILFW